MGVTVVLITCSYLEQEFIRIGYYVNNEAEEGQGEGPVPVESIYRNVLAERPRVTRFPIQWDAVPTFEEGGGFERMLLGHPTTMTMMFVFVCVGTMSP